MISTLADLAAALREAGATLAEAGARIPTLDPSPGFGTAGPGRLGALAEQWQHLWYGATDARVREALAQAHRLDRAADAVDRSAGRYIENEDAVRRALPEVS